MNRITVFLILVCAGLSLSLGVVVSRIIHAQPASMPLSGGGNIQLGLSYDAQSKTQDSSAIQSSSALLYDGDAQMILFQKNGFERRPLASITKLMTAMIALDHGISWNQDANILPSEYVEGGELILNPGETVTMKDLFNASLLGSANNATMAYVRQLGISKEDFVQEMNRKAVELRLEQTEFHDVTGLGVQNVSTAYEIAVMANYAFTHYPEIAQATSQKEYSFIVRGTHREHTIRNTNKYVQTEKMNVTGSKTGFLYEAGYCLVVQGADALKNRVAVIMNSPGEETQFIETKRLLTMQVK
ncbi:MAG: hypothetical protein A3E36_01210 [Candidatus Andersenbacteria bacterium RIFCSPHIGHO2_12_FULL_45_11b]|uniref:Peptidase S11 D-alanyl-D-alanine carboxypeptidase A N-terminal domain-containing protein n=1 Tax=Candidatus Andersenbacteria bacterium RIFCSPHIGHO2_12_FULL_45_11b TaxID=1797282 RepID=A0A1G1XBC6_9BACT|nr:MAG: hypothetical protein A3E36_01210 [Candidatus Andersenbacteria bacterium RIFCSPHIGHO2_12_FULL_45_11b]